METIFGSTISDKNSCQNCFFCFKIIKNVSFDYKRTGGYLRRETEENQWKTQSVYFLWPHQWRQPYESYIIWMPLILVKIIKSSEYKIEKFSLCKLKMEFSIFVSMKNKVKLLSNSKNGPFRSKKMPKSGQKSRL